MGETGCDIWGKGGVSAETHKNNRELALSRLREVAGRSGGNIVDSSKSQMPPKKPTNKD